MEADRRSIHKKILSCNTYFTKLIFQFNCSIFDLSTNSILFCQPKYYVYNSNKTLMEFSFISYSLLSKYIDFFTNSQVDMPVDNFTLTHGHGGLFYESKV